MNRAQRTFVLAAGAATLGAWLSAKPRFSFRGRVVLITGGSRGLGLIMARMLAEEGARVAICARDVEELERAGDDLRARGGDVLEIVCDVTDEWQVEEMVGEIIARWGRLDVLINNAGIIRMGPYDEITLHDYRECMDVHLFAAIHTVAAALPHMLRQGGGRIVNISSIGGLVSVPHLLAYCASKHALTGFSRGLESELARHGVRVTTICPGLMRTGSPVRAEFKGRHRAEQTWFTVTGSIPGPTIGAERAARKIIEACREGRSRLTISLPAKIAALADTVAPGVVSRGFGLIDRLLPPPGGIGTRHAEGLRSKSSLSPSALTTLTARAAERNNELPAGERWAHT